MARPELRTLLHRIHHLAGPCATAEPSDRDLLERFAKGRDEAAFAALVRRHGPLVLHVCRRLLRHEQDAEDVFQAAFLVLARKAGAIHWRDSVASWLHAVARRLALKARAEAVRRQRQERRAARQRPVTTADDLSWREAAAILEEELGRLPERYRAPLLLCCWEGRARDEAARLLGWTAGAVKGRLERGREMLRRRLARRGVALSAGLLAVGLARDGVPAALADATVRLALGGAVVAPAVAGLAGAALRALTAAKVRAAGALLAVTLLATGAAVWTHQALRGRPLPEATATEGRALPAPHKGAGDEVLAATPPAPANAPPEKPPDDKPPAPLPWPRADHAGDPLPAGAAERFGTTRFRQAAAIQLVAFSPDGKLLATAGGAGGAADPHVYLWDAATGKQLRRFELQATCLAFSPGSELLAAWGYGTAPPRQAGLRVWNTKSGVLWKEVTGRVLRMPDRLSFSADGARVWAFGPGEAAVWETGQTGKRDAFVAVPPVVPGATAILGAKGPKRQFLAFATGNGVYCVADERAAASGNDLRKGSILNLTQSGNAFTTLAFADNLLVAGTVLGDIHVWEIAGRAGKHLRTWRGSGGPLMALALTGSGDGPRLTSVSAHDTGIEVRVWDPKAGRELSLVMLAGSPRDKAGTAPSKIVLSRDGKRVAVAEAGGLRVRLWDTATGKELAASPGHAAAVRQVAFLPGGKTLASFGADGSLLLWPVGSGARPRHVTEPGRPVQLTALSPDGRFAAASRYPTSIVIFDMASGDSMSVLNTDVAVSCLAFAPDGKSLASGRASRGTGPDIWRLADKSRRTLGSAKLSPLNLAYSPDGKLLATDEAVEIGLWDVAAGRKLRTLAVPGAEPHLLAFDPQGQVLAVASRERDSVTLYDVATGSELRSSRRPGCRIHSLAFARGGRLLVTGDEDGLTLWEVASGAQVLCLTGHTGRVNAIAASPDGNRLVSGSDDATVMLWDLAAAWKETAPVPPRGKKPPASEELCHGLRDDGATAYRAIWALAAQRDKVLPALKKELLGTTTPADARRVRRLVADLDDADPKVRNRAFEGLRPVAASAESALRTALAGAKSDKLRARLRGFLGELEADGRIAPSEDARLAARAVDLLELIGTAEARKLLEALAKNGRTWPLQREAQAAVDRARAEKPAH